MTAETTGCHLRQPVVYALMEDLPLAGGAACQGKGGGKSLLSGQQFSPRHKTPHWAGGPTLPRESVLRSRQ